MKSATDETNGTMKRRQFVKSASLGVVAFCVGEAVVSQTGCRARESAFMPTRTQMKNALKGRISNDDPGNFNSNVGNWEQVRLGIYYDEDKELIDIVMYETTSQAVGGDRYLPDPVWRNLIASVGPQNTPEQAIDPMMDAAVRAERRSPNDEGPPSAGPSRKPTLRSARTAGD